ncbi:HAUS augmin-like complex subunit 3 [Stigmatopora argus]
MLSGKDFVEAMARLGYPGASSLEASEFDWMFTGPPENLPFLNFVCRGLNRGNVLTPEEVQAFDELQKSGKPILAQEALDELLKTVPPSEVDRPSAEGRPVEDLEAELQALRKEKKQKQQRLKMLEAAAASRADVAVSLASHLDGVSSQLTEAKASLVAENARANAGLQSLANQVEELTRGLLDPPANPREPLPFQHSPRESFATFSGDLAENLCSEQVPDPNREKNQVEETRTQLARLMQAHAVVQRQLAEAVAEEKSIEAGLRWLSNNSSSVQSLGDLSSLQMYKGEYRKKLRAAKAEMEALFVGPLSLALCESARLIAMAPVKADHSLELTRLGHITLWQNQLRDKLLCQKAASDILHLAQQMKSRKWKECLEHLGDMSGRLVGIREDASLALGRPELAVNVKPNPVVGSRDATFARLMQILDQESSRERAEPFLTYEAVERAAAGLSDNLRAGRESLGAAAREQRGATAGLEDHCEALDEAVSTELGQLVLGPKLSLKAIAGQELLCANAKEVKEKLSEADLQLQRLLKRLPESSGKVNARRSRLARDPLLASERNVYTRFHSDAAALPKAVEDLERKRKLTRGKP